MTDSKRLDAKCTSCGHVWTMVYLPVPVDLLNKFAKTPCPKCHAPKPVMAGKDDLTEEDRLRELVRKSYHALAPDRPTGPYSGQILRRLRDQMEVVVKAHFPGEVGPLGSEGESDQPKPTLATDRVQHVKRGSTYRVLARGKVQTGTPLTDCAEVVVYQGEADGLVWVRPVTEFEDGRFVALAALKGSE